MIMGVIKLAIHSYICKECGNKFDIYIGIGGRKDKLVCKNCGSKNIEKDFSSISIGSGNKDNGACPTGTCSLG